MAAGELEPRYRHALLIGTTGMLAAASAWIAGRTERVTVVARRASEFRLGDPVLDGRLERIAADYADTDAFIAGLEVRLSAAAGLDLCVTWIRPAAHDLRDRIAVLLHASRARLVEISGSRSLKPGGFAERRAETMRTYFAELPYQQIILGLRPSASGPRTLSHAEISEGTIQALRSGGARHLIGDPSRPS